MPGTDTDISRIWLNRNFRHTWEKKEGKKDIESDGHAYGLAACIIKHGVLRIDVSSIIVDPRTMTYLLQKLLALLTTRKLQRVGVPDNCKRCSFAFGSHLQLPYRTWAILWKIHDLFFCFVIIMLPPQREHCLSTRRSYLSTRIWSPGSCASEDAWPATWLDTPYSTLLHCFSMMCYDTWPFHMCAVTHAHVTRLVHMCDMTHPHMKERKKHMTPSQIWHYSVIYVKWLMQGTRPD